MPQLRAEIRPHLRVHRCFVPREFVLQQRAQAAAVGHGQLAADGIPRAGIHVHAVVREALGQIIEPLFHSCSPYRPATSLGSSLRR